MEFVEIHAPAERPHTPDIRMNVDECLRTLGVGPDATEDELRQAYLDQVRVWHPDRFQSDPRLRLRAQEQLRQINEAYAVLKDRRPPVNGGRPAPEQAAPPPRPTPRPAPPPPPSWSPPASGAYFRPSPRPRWGPALSSKVQYAILLAVLFLVPVLTAVRIRSLLHIQVLEPEFLNAHSIRPQILEPAQIIDPLGDARVAADTLTEWARGEAIDLWKPVPGHAPSPPGAPARTVSETLRKPGHPAAGHTSGAAPAREGQPLPENGAELLDSGRHPGAGELVVANQTELEVIACLVHGSNLLRAVYIKPGASASIIGIRMGVYYLHVRAGKGLDQSQLRFRSDRYEPPPLGPFEFMEVSSASGTSGGRFEVALKAPAH